jgi:Flp pilus assembly protein TadB
MASGLSGNSKERLAEVIDPVEEELDWSNVSYQLSEIQSTLYSIHDQLKRLRRKEQTPGDMRRRISAMFLVLSINAMLLLAIVVLLAVRL